MKKLFRTRDIILDNIVANNARQTSTINQNGLLIVNVKANNFDKNCINNYYSTCNMKLNYNTYVESLIKEFGHSRSSIYYNFQILIFKYGTSFNIIDKVKNDYSDYLKDNILFRIYIEEVKYNANVTKYLI